MKVDRALRDREPKPESVRPALGVGLVEGLENAIELAVRKRPGRGRLP